jgi:phosphoribosyl 1,2-cyclic phosphodiesterase
VKARIWGSRGTVATPGNDTVRYGGNTACVEVRLDDGGILILDGGTGLRVLGAQLAQETLPRIDLLITHLHIDHVEGLGVFEPIWRPETELHIWGPPSPIVSLDERLAWYFSPPLFPVHLSEVPARVEFHDTPDGEWSVNGSTLFSTPIRHPGATVGYRIEADGASLAYLTDHEPAFGGLGALDVPPEWISGYAVAAGADVLFHDCQYTDLEYADRIGFGHSSVDHVARFADIAEVDRLVLYHHDPMHTDDQLEVIRDGVVERWGVEDERVALAAEGATIEV